MSCRPKPALRSPTASAALLAMTTSLAFLDVALATRSGQANASLFDVRPKKRQQPSSHFLLELIDNPLLAKKVLTQGRLIVDKRHPIRFMTRKKPTEPALMLRLWVKLDGHPAIKAFFKPNQHRYRDWATETVACRLAHELAVRIAPCAERSIAYHIIAKILPSIPAAHKRRIKWRHGSVFGFFRVWAPHYREGLGPHRPSRKLAKAMASLLIPRNRSKINSHYVFRDLSDILLFDFIIYNNDRWRNIGMIRRDNDSLQLFPIDFGDGLWGNPQRKIFRKTLLQRVSLFRKPLIQRILALTKKRLRELATHKNYGLLIGQRELDRVWRQRSDLLHYIDHMKRRYKATIWL